MSFILDNFGRTLQKRKESATMILISENYKTGGSKMSGELFGNITSTQRDVQRIEQVTPICISALRMLSSILPTLFFPNPSQEEMT